MELMQSEVHGFESLLSPEIVSTVTRVGCYVLRDTGRSILEEGEVHPELIDRNALLVYDAMEFMEEKTHPGWMVVGYESQLGTCSFGRVRELTAREAVQACVSAHLVLGRRLLRSTPTSSRHWGGVSHLGSSDFIVSIHQRPKYHTIGIALRGRPLPSPFSRMLCVRL
jgi:hypothetical protein